MSLSRIVCFISGYLVDFLLILDLLFFERESCGVEKSRKLRNKVRIMLGKVYEGKYLDFGDGVDLVEIVVWSVAYIACVVLEFGRGRKMKYWGAHRNCDT